MSLLQLKSTEILISTPLLALEFKQYGLIWQWIAEKNNVYIQIVWFQLPVMFKELPLYFQGCI